MSNVDLSTGVSAGWHAQNYEVYDWEWSGFVDSILWGYINTSPQIWVEMGYDWSRQGTYSYSATKMGEFFPARYDGRIADENQKFAMGWPALTPEGYPTWHQYKITFNDYGYGRWNHYLDSGRVGCFGDLPGDLVAMKVGIEECSNCSSMHTTYFGS